MSAEFENVLTIAQTLIRDAAGEEPVTTELIVSKVDLALSLNPAWKEQIDRPKLIKELETRFSIWIGTESFLSGNDDHIPWLKAECKEGWRYWPRYRQWLEPKWSSTAITSLDRVTDRIVGALEDPKRPGAWDRRGLVVGHVQSGKTANYTGVVCKAADAGYKLIVILAGIHKNLRSQTQMRLDEGFLGYETMPVTRMEGANLRRIGVGDIDKDPAIRPNYVTHRGDDGDFKLAAARNIGITPDTRPWLFVIKKNKTVLDNLINWATSQLSHSTDRETGRPTITGLPLLVIDDEADHASVDTGEQEFFEDGTPDPEHEPKAINRLIRRLLYIFDQSAYVGYTATPFANIFIHERGKTSEHGEDLFPRSFLLGLPVPSNYAGPARVFGVTPDEVETSEGSLPLLRHIRDHAASLRLDEALGWMPPRHRNGHLPLLDGRDEIPPSLQTAILSFLLSCAARRLRGQNAQHNSMLVHVTRFTSVQKRVREQVDAYLQGVVRRLKLATADAALTERLRNLWNEDYVATTDEMRRRGMVDDPAASWESIRSVLPLVAADIEIREINGSAKDILDYETHRATGFNVIAIGGDKLARGLTLEGLTVSYFLRASRMYDTLMQMGRWFGYRPGYLDLTRLFTTPDLEEWFEHITEASEELREELDHMVAVGGTPRDYGLKVKSHPVLMVTSRVKMRNAQEMLLSFEGKVPETIIFPTSPAILAANAKSAATFLASCGAPVRDPERRRASTLSGVHRWKGSLLWEHIQGTQVSAFLRQYQTHPDALKVNSQLLANFIDRQIRDGALTDWTVALLSGDAKVDDKPLMADLDGLSVQMITRKEKREDGEERIAGRFVIGRLLAPRDEAIDLDERQYAAALAITVATYRSGEMRTRRKTDPEEPSGPSIRQVRGLGSNAHGIGGDPRRGLLLVYPIVPPPDVTDYKAAIIGIGISFPANHDAVPISYKVNNVYWDQEFGGSA